jgi:hypothetical protein
MLINAYGWGSVSDDDLNLAVALALGKDICLDPQCSGCDSWGFVRDGKLESQNLLCGSPWATSADACFRDLIPDAVNRGCSWQMQSLSGHVGFVRFVFMLSELSGLTYNERIRDAIDTVPRAICLAWLKSRLP